jgi:lipoyl(octanoyl) transferase
MTLKQKVIIKTDMQVNDQEIEWLESKDPVDFEVALNFMQTRVEKIINNQAKQLIWVLEHPEIYTAGISAKDSDLLAKTEIPIFKINRGGKYTYHGPRMKIIYVMLDLKKFFYPNQPDIAKFVQFLENWIIAALAEINIKGEIKKDRVGIWVNHQGQEKKIAAIGIKIKKWVSYHGIAINIDPDLNRFDNIIPCGIKEYGVTSVREVLGSGFNKKIVEGSSVILKNSFLKIKDLKKLCKIKTSQ